MYILKILHKYPRIIFLKTCLTEQVSFYIYLKNKQDTDQQKIYWKLGLKYFEHVGMGHQCSWRESISSMNDVARAALKNWETKL